MTENNTKFEWDATDSGPKHYPMEIIRGSFIYKGEKERGLYIPSGGTLMAGWGYPFSSHVVGEKYKPLPDRLEITFFSYAEKQFFRGKFDLPYDRILEIFRQGIAEDPQNPTFSRIMAGIAPGGIVAVWVIGSSGSEEVFFGQAEKVSLNPSAAFALPFKDKADAEDYMHEVFVESITAEELESINRDGIPFDLWSRYRNRYEWYPVVKGGHTRKYVNIEYLNAESGEIYFNEVEDSSAHTLRPAPRWITFKANVDGKNTLFEVRFDKDELETMQAFEKLGSDGQKLYLEFSPTRPRSNTTVRIYNDKESVQLRNILSEDW